MKLFSSLIALGVGGAALVLLSTSMEEPTRQIDAEEFTPLDFQEKQGAAPCPPGASEGGLGPVMALLPEGFCIDTTEVTRGQYAAWLDSAPSTDEQSEACTENNDFTPSCAWEPGKDENKPVGCVDWCDAKAFCEAAGKRLCGSIGDGQAYAFEDYADAAVSEWQAACSSGGINEYSYGNEPDTQICRGGDAEDYTTWGVTDVGALSECHSSESQYSEVADLSGNVAEWDNSCVGDGPSDGCRIRGGSFQHQGRGLRCAMAKEFSWPRDRTAQAVGFRCCGDD